MMDAVYEYYCTFCLRFTNSEFVCPSCNEYKGMVKVSENQELIKE